MSRVITSPRKLLLRILQRTMSTPAEQILKQLKDHERSGVPSGAGTDTDRGFDLGRIRRLLEDLKQPQSQLPVVHLAGTKGKGSVAAMLSAILHHSQYKVGSYTSPHVNHLRERIAVGLQAISISDFDSLATPYAGVLQNASQREGGLLSHFEALTALALQHFVEQKVDIAVIEAGIGGVRDATNVFDKKTLQLAVITAIGKEHQVVLGNSLREIAAAKAGIMKRPRPVVIARQPEAEAMETLRDCASQAGCPVIESNREVQVSAGSIHRDGDAFWQEFSLQLNSKEHEEICAELANTVVRSRLIGSHQADNAAAAVASAVQLQGHGWSRISGRSIVAGLESAFLPGRFQVGRLGVAGPWLVLDGCHTPESAAALAHTLRAAFPDQPLALVLAMASDKDHAGVAAMLRRARPTVVTFTSVPVAGASHRSAPPGMLAGHWQAAGFAEERPIRSRELMQASMGAAIEMSQRELQSQSAEGVVCVCGSLHAVAAALEYMGQQPPPESALGRGSIDE